MDRITVKDFYEKSAIELAPQLLGKYICRNIDGEILKARITDVEIYFGESDTACHASKGKTERNKIMYYSGGHCYVYLCYGLHSLFNIISGKEGHPEGIMIRGIENIDGPGRVAKYLHIDKSLNGEYLVSSDKIWIEDDNFIGEYESLKRVGIEYATADDREKLWRIRLK